MEKKLIFIQVGQCGNQIGNAFWELQCVQNGLLSDGTIISEYYPSLNDNQNSTFTDRFFDVISNTKFKARSVLIDTDPSTIDEIQCGGYRHLYHPRRLIRAPEDAGSNFARGVIKYATKFFDRCVNEIRLTLEEVDYLDGIMLLNSIGGGTGSGLSCLLMHMMVIDNFKISKTQYFVAPNTECMVASVEPYNAILHVHNIFEATELGIVTSNNQLYKIEKNILSIPSPSYYQINKILSLFLGTLTSNPYSMKQTHTNLVPFPRIHFTFPSLSPLIHFSQVHNKLSLNLIAKNLFNQSHFLVSFPAARFVYISMLVNFLGNFSGHSFFDSVQTMKTNEKIKFVDWVPSGIKFQMSKTQICNNLVENLFQSDVTTSLLANSSAIKYIWINLNKLFYSMFRRKAFIYWYLEEGLEESEFLEAYNNIEYLIEDYNELTKPGDDDFVEYNSSNKVMEETETEILKRKNNKNICLARSLIDMRLRELNRSRL